MRHSKDANYRASNNREARRVSMRAGADRSHFMTILSLVLGLNFVVRGTYALLLFPRSPSRKFNQRLPLSMLKAIPTDKKNFQSTTRKNDVGKNPASSRSTAIFALQASSRRPSAIALRVLENDPAYKSLDRRDRAYARLLLTTVERRQGQIDKILQQLSLNAKIKKV